MPSGWQVATHLENDLWDGIFKKKQNNEMIVNKYCKVYQNLGVLPSD